MHATLAGGSAAFNVTHDSIAPSPDYQQPAPKKPARGSRKAKNMARFEAQYDEDVHIGETRPFAHCLLMVYPTGFVRCS